MSRDRCRLWLSSAETRSQMVCAPARESRFVDHWAKGSLLEPRSGCSVYCCIASSCPRRWLVARAKGPFVDSFASCLSSPNEIISLDLSARQNTCERLIFRFQAMPLGDRATEPSPSSWKRQSAWRRRMKLISALNALAQQLGGSQSRRSLRVPQVSHRRARRLPLFWHLD